ncbi:hypothetical protein KAFR_0F00950 [Kazachstania africana CBS 2517]|uniref:Spindle pole component Bbp1 N-terminal domain-containing protein n=1 Tax=Kazachstania africana (strain ATCC 22294 / BCRC 22015 / CBS 2517 / CECT 1963 / NBRC 1671 / NRRL Y-8276) TaxID=1071382 RepID=H2AWE2_KAZAF|nr:hypothetical protein KAFR_0F00950 [Kazachstania africana CBS 2517]CCF58692.1 hypothetical protein KAFR_0F00950 [Kazachstania africana CBS 2517]
MDSETENGTSSGLFKWTMDALFGTKISPSKKYKQNFYSQDDTNYNNMRRTRLQKSRSNSFDGFSPTFCNKYDLLHNDKTDSLPSYHDGLDNLMSPIHLATKNKGQHHTDTFANKNLKKDYIFQYKSPQKDDPLISRLFHDPRIRKDVTDHTQVPGKFPSPLKRQQQRQQDLVSNNDYKLLLTDLNENNKLLSDISNEIKQQNDIAIDVLNKENEMLKLELVKRINYITEFNERYLNLRQKYNTLKFENSENKDKINMLMEDKTYLNARIIKLEQTISGLNIENARFKNESKFPIRDRYRHPSRSNNHNFESDSSLDTQYLLRNL